MQDRARVRARMSWPKSIVITFIVEFYFSEIYISQIQSAVTTKSSEPNLVSSGCAWPPSFRSCTFKHLKVGAQTLLIIKQKIGETLSSFLQTYFNFIISRLISYKHLTNSPSVVTECGVALWALVHNRANLQIRHLREHQKCQKAQKYKQIQTSMKFQLLDIWN